MLHKKHNGEVCILSFLPRGAALCQSRVPLVGEDWTCIVKLPAATEEKNIVLEKKLPETGNLVCKSLKSLVLCMITPSLLYHPLKNHTAS